MMYNGGPNQPELPVGSIRQFMCNGGSVIGIVLTVGSLYYNVVTIHGMYRTIEKVVPYKQVKLSFSERVRIDKARDLLLKKEKIKQEKFALDIEEDKIDMELGSLGF